MHIIILSMKAEEYFNYYCIHGQDLLSVLNLNPTDKPYRERLYSGSTKQTSRSIDGNKELYSEWNNGQRNGRAFLRDEYGEDLMSCCFKGGVLHGMCIIRGSDKIYSIEYEEGYPTGKVQYTVMSTGAQWQCIYECSDVIKELKCLNGSDSTYKFPKMKCMDSIHPKKELESFNIQPITISSAFTRESYNTSIARSVWLESLSRVRQLQQQPNGESERSKLKDFLNLYENYMTIYNAITERVNVVKEKWDNKVKKQQASESMSIKKRTSGEEEPKAKQGSRQINVLRPAPQAPVLSTPQPTGRQIRNPQPRRGKLSKELKEEKVVATKEDISRLPKRNRSCVC
ncbi:hypothetical protein JH06_0259 [Blastocystis sp. subtype 4]|uniref:hypothetical protein n=1 Tax=Blastocystis sp. subtype 4 TaxID=944170 RepID=UPI00071205C1|nr:hypothetical protein JH06_0259 [Blastocystis sp. subtype 4]KNB46118.1 hypothetical protein JH06_0259 [Blastocystis sp. subtype 4]|eukprot:XP_014529561.1 hypothetical protein JH06_0259 [Blastocystis sp. subtype 4]